MSVLHSEELPVSQRAAVSRVHNDHVKTSLETVPVPQLKPGEILVKMTWSALCYNDIGLMRNYWPDTPFQTAAQGISGHEGVGNVVAIAEDVLQADLWRIGDRVGIKWLASICGECEFCTNGRDEVHCVKPVFSGFSTPGTFQQYVATDARFALRLPDGISDEEAAPLLCAGLTSYVATKKSQVQQGQWVVLLGAGGGLGHLSVQYAKAMGMRTIAVDIGPEKGDLCREVGAEIYIDASTCEDLAAEVNKITPYGAHGAVVLAPSAQAYESALSLVRPTGTVVVVAFTQNMSFKMGLQPVMFASAQHKVVGSTTGTRKEAAEMFDLTVKGHVHPKLHKCSLGDVEDIMDLIQGKKLLGKAVLKIDL